MTRTRSRRARGLFAARERPRLLVRPIILPGLLLFAAAALNLLQPAPLHAAPVAATTTIVGLGTIPSIEGRTLAGDTVRLPIDLLSPGTPDTGRTAVLIVGFGREASSAARDWGLRLAADTANSPTTVYYEMPVLAGVPRLFRGPILRLMAGSVSERGRHHFLPITEEEAAWRSAVGFHDAAVPYILVVDDHGTVRWRTSGAFTAPMYARLQEYLPAAAH